MINTGSPDARTMASPTLPISHRVIPDRPCVVITMRSFGVSWAKSSKACGADPRKTLKRARTP